MKKSQWLFRLQRFNDGGGEGGNDGGGGSGGVAGANDGGAQQNGGGDKGGESKPAVAFSSQEEYDSALQGAVRDFLKELGIEKADDLKGIVDSHKQKQEAEKTAEQKLLERESDLKNANGTIQSLRIENAFTLEAIKQGIDPDKLSDAIRLADLGKVEVTEAGKVKNIDKYVTELITSKPWLKADETTRGNTPAAKPLANQKSTIPNISDLRKLQRI
ncbi:hypothetical protein [Brevibacillus brevis]|uniref:hypothetical protein n=1 Tax=Brevibacillus brevis TaxID=1393 RepID=UPI000D1018DA|nr:hypothetical protein [Brevibacillus brevis]PSJ66298.1 hypothetical protein C7J99_26540 [Brevibacillus brevis]RED21808.1 hypothetical protein DES34_11873 [Brevibacillus brevis]GEC92426.1 hypothetical protein BBR01nite_47570 [Brevibacillus brevis]VEF92671.1 Uncharacterised protein [Brevibacillus brevis]